MRSKLGAIIRVVTSIALASWTSMASVAAAAELVVRWCDPYGLLERGSARVGGELISIFDEMGVQLIWTKCARAASPESSPAHPAPREIQVLLVESDPAEWRLSPMAMGAVLSQDGPQSEVYVFFRSVARVLGYAPEAVRKRWPTPREERDLSRALGRVIAHEVIHAVLPERAHAGEGLTHFKLDRTSLLGRRIHVDAAVGQALKVALFPKVAEVRAVPNTTRLGSEKK